MTLHEQGDRFGITFDTYTSVYLVAGAYFRTNIIGIGGIDQHAALWRSIQTGARDQTKLYAHASLTKYTFVSFSTQHTSWMLRRGGGHQHYGPV